MTPTLERFAAVEKPAIEAVLRRAIGDLGPPLGAVALYTVRAGGKRIRPLLTVASFQAVGGETTQRDPTGAWPSHPLYGVAAAVELIHTYSLLHDDLPCMDDDDLRRGLPTPHKVYGVKAATLAGAAIQQLAYREIGHTVATDPHCLEIFPELVGRLARAAGFEGMVGGQFLDLEAEGGRLDPAGVEAIHQGKTAALVSAACAVGGLIGGASREVVDALASYGTNLGLAFQIVDDVLDVTGDSSRMGKSAGADAALEKATYPALFGIEGARELAKLAGEDALDRLAAVDVDGDVLEAFVSFVLERLH